MTLEDLISFITTDKVALLFFFMLLPMVTFVLTLVSSGRSIKPPFSYLYTGVLVAVSIPAVLSMTLWAYSTLFEHQSLWTLPFFVYYLPIIVMLLCLGMMKKKKISIQDLPWSAEVYEFLILVIISFASTLIIMKLEILNFKSVPQMGIFFAFWLILIYFGWKRFKELS